MNVSDVMNCCRLNVPTLQELQLGKTLNIYSSKTQLIDIIPKT